MWMHHLQPVQLFSGHSAMNWLRRWCIARRSSSTSWGITCTPNSPQNVPALSNMKRVCRRTRGCIDGSECNVKIARVPSARSGDCAPLAAHWWRPLRLPLHPCNAESGLVDCRVSFDAVVHRSQQTLSDGLLSCTSTLQRDYFWELKYFRVVFGPLCPQLDLSDQAPCSVYPTYTYLEVLLGASSGDGVYGWFCGEKMPSSGEVRCCFALFLLLVVACDLPMARG